MSNLMIRVGTGVVDVVVQGHLQSERAQRAGSVRLGTDRLPWGLRGRWLAARKAGMEAQRAGEGATHVAEGGYYAIYAANQEPADFGPS